ncbi:MAG: universal stress protein [Thermodesulfovibrionia bacterium]
MKVERILFPTDFSEGARHALHYAVDLARHYSARLYILHVIYDIAKATESHIPHISADEIYSEMTKWAMDELERCCIEEVRGLPNVERIVIKGIPHEEIVKFAVDKEIDMIVMGTYGRTGIQKLIFGDTAEKVVKKAPCPVMTVRIPEHRERS